MTDSVKHEIGRDWASYYRQYQSRLANEYLIPILKRWGIDLAGKRVLEVGCGDGGCAAAFHRAGAEIVMMDIEERLVDVAREANANEGIEAKAYAGNVYDEAAPFYDDGPYDIIMFRDVMEHLEDPVRALQIVSQHLTADGVVFAVFPPTTRRSARTNKFCRARPSVRCRTISCPSFSAAQPNFQCDHQR